MLTHTHARAPPQDCFSSTSTADAVYTNDVNVLLDITLREARDLPPKNDVRAKYVKVLHLVMLNSRWFEGKYRRQEIKELVESFVDAGKGEMGEVTMLEVDDLLADCLGMLEPEE